MSKDTFKTFARMHPELGKIVMSGKSSWQKLFELYEIYGESNSVWSDYFTSNSISSTSNVITPTSTVGELFNTIKNVDLDSVQKGVNNLQKTIGLLQDLGIGGSSSIKPKSYEARPLYKSFED